MYIQRTCVLYSAVITRQSHPSISQFSRPCNEFTVSGQCSRATTIVVRCHGSSNTMKQNLDCMGSFETPCCNILKWNNSLNNTYNPFSSKVYKF